MNHRSLGALSFAVVATLVAFAAACGSDPEPVGFHPRETADDTDPSTGSSSSGGTFGAPVEAGPAPVAPTTDVEAVVTADNAFSFGWGSDSALTTFIRGEGSDGNAIFNCPVGFGPIRFVVPAASAPPSAYLYVVAWADNDVTQGALAQFKRVGGTPIYSGNGAWEVCAVGKAFADLGPGPDQATVDARIADCNSGKVGATYSKGWVVPTGASTRTPGAIGKLAFGEANDSPAGNFPIVCQKDAKGVSGIDAVARWMWFDPMDGQSPFVGNTNNRTKTFLIFRLAASVLPVPPVK